MGNKSKTGKTTGGGGGREKHESGAQKRKLAKLKPEMNQKLASSAAAVFERFGVVRVPVSNVDRKLQSDGQSIVNCL